LPNSVSNAFAHSVAESTQNSHKDAEPDSVAVKDAGPDADLDLHTVRSLV
jgi:hypothetical protein